MENLERGPEPNQEEQQEKDDQHKTMQRVLQKGFKSLFAFIFRQPRMVFEFLWTNLKILLLSVINLQATTDQEGTVKSIKAGIEIKGYNIWILIASCVLACIGLDTNSTAVIIGAMLISPLMSPIIGIGLSIGINDRVTLQNSLYNFAIAVAISLLTAFVYFLLSPLGRETAEMAARTKPTILDIAVGFFGGVAGIVAGSRKDKTNAIPGVAIATALMPPLCVAGFGLAKFNLPYFAGAFYLFFLNAVFISLSTFLIVRFLKFPLVEKYTESFQKNFTRGVVAFVLISMVPAVWLFVDVIIDSRRESKIEAFLEDKFGANKIAFSVEKREVIETDSTDYLRVTVASPIYLPKDTVAKYNAELLSKYRLKHMQLLLIQTTADPNDRQQILKQAQAQTQATLDLFKKELETSEARRLEIEGLQQEIERLKNGDLALLDIREDIRDMIPELKQVEFGQLRTAIMSDSTKRLDPASDVPEFFLRLTWNDSLPKSMAIDRKARIEDRLKTKYALEKVVLLDANTPFKR